MQTGVILQNNDENTIGRTCKQVGSFNGIKKEQLCVTSERDSSKESLVKFNTYMTYWSHGRQKKTTYNLTSLGK